ncbi:MAG TPA: peptidase S41, partial [Halieaceae bacterium]|nr:peptidase S41 [Halieaceae bacterium]
RERSVSNPDFVYLEEQVHLAEEARTVKALPLNEKARIAMREMQESKALAIENRRRAARGEELLTSLEDEFVEDDEDAEPVPDADADELEQPDVLLTEAGNILVDALLLRQQQFAQHSESGADEH